MASESSSVIVIVVAVGIAAWCLVQLARGRNLGAAPSGPAAQGTPSDFCSIQYAGLAFVVLIVAFLLLLRFERAREAVGGHRKRRRSRM